MKRPFRAWAQVYLPAFAASLAYLGVYLYIHAQKMMFVTRPVAFGCLGFFATYALFAGVLFALHACRRRRWIRPAVYGVLLFVQTVLLFYYILEGGYLDYGLVRTYLVEILTNANTIRLFFDIGGLPLVVGIGATVALIFLLARTGAFHPDPPSRAGVLARAAVAGACVAAFFVFGRDNPNPLYVFARSFSTYNAEADADLLPPTDGPAYPYRREFAPTHPWPEGKRRPHVFIVMLESVGSRFVNAKTPDGRPVMPNLAALSKRARSYPLAFTPSIFTERSHSSLLCSILPSFRKKIMRYYVGNSLRCLPRVLAEFGYRSLGFKGDKDDEFDNEITFLRKIGFDEAYAMRDEFLNEEERAHVWGWGLQDDYFFRRVFRHLDETVRAYPGRPLMSFLATISNHTPFNKVPREMRTLYPEPANLSEHYLTSLNVADRFLPTFFAELERRPEFRDALVFVMGDHGIRVGWREDRSTTYQNDFFHVPLLVRWPGRVRPGSVDSNPHSLIDVAPTILDWLGMAAPVQFIGSPMLLDPVPAPPRIVHLIQPYDGMFMAAIEYPWKYVHSLSDGREYLYDLSTDPEERVDLAGAPEHRARIKALRASLGDIFLNQKLIQEDRIYPHEGLASPLPDGQSPIRVPPVTRR